MEIVFILLFSSLLSFLLCSAYINLFKFYLPIDVPNDRSAHKEATYNGAGVGVLISIYISLFITFYFDLIGREFLIYTTLSSWFIAIISFIDDYRPQTPLSRLAIQLIAIFLFLYFIYPLPDLYFFGNYIEVGLLGIVLSFFLLMWIVNLFNFMDGINGITSLEVISFSISLIVSFYILEILTDLYLVLSIIAGTCLGFLPLNFPKAKVFLGDVGSCTLGFLIGCLIFLASLEDSKLFWVSFIFLGIYIVDTTYTLFYRIFTGQKFYVAHSHHGYQIASKKLNSHTKVSVLVFAINICWLLPLGLISLVGYFDPLLSLIISYTPLILLRKRLGNV
jgi:Fuc2NAc and GlcNAc transferase